MQGPTRCFRMLVQKISSDVVDFDVAKMEQNALTAMWKASWGLARKCERLEYRLICTVLFITEQI